ncbi:hypothetical protein [Micropruina sonneratiae]|uniref:hypothetical protein n=1 Tax=Micropruina sonneratiae TaxID=2986940 RepID=UPI002226F8C1|nr:hypothetical protein [Micropruina sp. KQZ13P-5]MCW3157698.1 hypothetical protein [Micropruina sp. KQZ13P-5]
MTETSLLFLPWVRRGGTVALPPDDRAGHPANQVGTTVGVSVNGSPGAAVPVQLLGPGAVTGVAPQQVIRTDPAPNAQNFESNYLALVEFDDPGLPWLFTPASASGGRLRPWLCLVVVREQPGVQLQPAGTSALPVLRIGAPARPELELPDLADSWAWAHAQVVMTGGSGGADVAAALAGDPARNLSRLVCGRLLAEQTGYLACVVPTFEAGRRTGLGDEVGDAQGPAWTRADGMGTVELPVYHHWRFATGPKGDFQSLALAIRGRPVEDGFGLRPLDLSTAGLGLSGTDDAQELLGGALLALDAPTQRWSDAALPGRFATALRSVLNAPDAATAGQPLLAPPRYGSAYRSPAALASGADRWYEQLNLDPAARVAAALGTLVVQRQQETLVGAAWDQSVDLGAGTRLVGLAALGFAMAQSLHRRHIAPLSPQAGLFVLAPLRGALMAAPAATGGQSFAAQWAQADLPGATLGSAVRRVTRLRGPAVRTAERDGTMPPLLDWIGSMVPGAVVARGFGAPDGPLTFDAVGSTLPPPVPLPWAALTAAAVTASAQQPTFGVSATPAPTAPRPFPPLGEVAGDLGGGALSRPALRADDGGGPTPVRRRRPRDTPITPPTPPTPATPEDPPHHPPRSDSAAAALFRTVAAKQLTGFVAARPDPGAVTGSVSLDALMTEAVALTAPVRTFTAALGTLFSAPPPPATADTPLPDLRFTPRFDTPMAHSLAELGQHWLLPGLAGVPADTALALRTNGAFVEAFMVGLNHEFGRELLWREFPTPLTATFFDRFWDAAVAPSEPPDIPQLADWGERTLGAPTLRPERFVLLLRSELMRRFPDAVVSAHRTGSDPAQALLPVFRGSLDPDVTFFGFTIALAEADGYAISIAEQPGAPRFGFEVGQAPDGVSHAPATDASAAALAGRLRQLPARITMPITVLMREPES